MYVFRQGDIEIVVCGKRAMVSYRDRTSVINLEKSDIDKELRVFPEKFREFAKKQIMKVLSGGK